jgi:hypothetical protein
MEDAGIFYRHLVHFTVFCYISWTFGIVHGNLVYFSPFWYFVPRKIWQPRSLDRVLISDSLCVDLFWSSGGRKKDKRVLDEK